MYTVKREIISFKVSNGTINMIHQITISLKIITSPSKKPYSKVVRNRRLDCNTCCECGTDTHQFWFSPSILSSKHWVGSSWTPAGITALKKASARDFLLKLSDNIFLMWL